jgi:putative endonuclease
MTRLIDGITNVRHPEALRAAKPRRTHDLMGAYLYILLCADGSYYVGTTTSGLEHRLAAHQSGALGGYTAIRRPVTLMYHQYFDRLENAAAAERQVKGWRREKKEALIRGDFGALPDLASRPTARMSGI